MLAECCPAPLQHSSSVTDDVVIKCNNESHILPQTLIQLCEEGQETVRLLQTLLKGSNLEEKRKSGQGKHVAD